MTGPEGDPLTDCPYCRLLSVFQHFVGQIISVETTDTQGPTGVKLTLARAPIKAPSQEEVGPATPDPEYFSTVSVRV